MITHQKHIMLTNKNAESKLNFSRNDERGSIGIGAMIVFIALILVAAVASTVIIKTAEELQDRAEKTGDDTRDQISGKLIITDVYVNDDTTPDGDINSLTVYAKLASGSDPTLETAMTYLIVCDNTGFQTDTATVDALDTAGNDIGATTTLSSGEMFRFDIPLATATGCQEAAVVGASLPLTLNVEGGGDTRVDLEIETVDVGAKLI